MFEHSAHKANQESLNEVVLFGLIGAFLTESKLDANFMRSLSSSDVASLFSLPTTEKEDISGEPQYSTISSIVSVEKRGALADYADLLANVLYKAGMALKDNNLSDLSSLLEKENIDDVDTALDVISRNLSSVIQSLDDRHFVSIKREGSEHMVELPFFKNARRMVSSVFMKKCLNQSGALDHVTRKLSDMIAAPSVRTINTLIFLDILSYCSGDGEEEIKSEDTSNRSSSAIGKEVSMRCAAVVACWKLSGAIQQLVAARGLNDIKVNPILLSTFLDLVPKPNTVNNCTYHAFIPHETGQKW